jgi:5'-deoxynucleotidase YfbR-like HD superfamily hydrolase
VAQHSLLVEDIFGLLNPDASPEAQLAALLHDAPEYVIGDMISPFKSVVGGGYKLVENRLQRAVHLRFSLPPAMPAALKKAIKQGDQIAAYLESTQLAGFSPAEAVRFFGRPRGIPPDRFDLTPRPAKAVEAAFLDRFQAIEARRR